MQTVAKVVRVEQAWMAKDEAQIHFGYKNHKSLYQKLLKEFKDHPDFNSGYRLVTSNMPIVNIKKFDEFLIWREKNKYRRKKLENIK